MSETPFIRGRDGQLHSNPHWSAPPMVGPMGPGVLREGLGSRYPCPPSPADNYFKTAESPKPFIP